MIHRRMVKRTSAFLKRFRKETSANALILTAFGMPMIIGGGGFAIDFTQYYLWKRELQYATDQAAIAAAWVLAENQNATADEYTARALTEFNANEEVTATFNSTPIVRKSHYAGVFNNAITVEASATKSLPFTSYFSSTPTTVSVSAQAAFTGGATVSNCLISTDKSDSDAIRLNGDAVFTAGCGIMAMSDSKKICTTTYDLNGDCIDYPDGTSGWSGRDAITVNGQPTIDAGSIVSAGTIDDQLDTMLTDPDDPNSGTNLILEEIPQDQLVDPFEGLDPPLDAVTWDGDYRCKSTGKKEYELNPDGSFKLDANGNKILKVFDLGVAKPGIYTRGLTVSCDTTFQPGIYVIDGGALKITGNYSVVGTDIMFILTGGAKLQLGGNSNAQLGEINIDSDLTVNLQGITYDTLVSSPYNVSDADAKKMDGMLIFEDPDSEGANPSGEGNGHLFAGTSSTWISGAIYLPKSSITMAGTAQVANICLLIVANKVTLTGTTDMTEFCPNDQTFQTSVIFGTVKLVA